MIFGILLVCEENVMATLHVALVHHIHQTQKIPGATRSIVQAGNRVFHISTRHVQWNCSFSFSSLGALVCYAAERINLASDEHHLARLSQLASTID